MDYKFKSVTSHQVRINISTMEQALREVELLVENKSNEYVCFFEANLFHRALSNATIRDVINEAALTYPDGVAAARSASLQLGSPVKRISGPSFLLQACEYGLSRKWRHFFLGGAGGVAEKLASNLKQQYPGLQVAGCYCPPFRPLTGNEELEVKQLIEDSHADLLWVGLGGPKQELWMNAHKGKIMVPVMLGVGAAFDFHSRNRPWAPRLVRKLGLEWLYRSISGGHRIIIRNGICVSHVGSVLLLDHLKYFWDRIPVVSSKNKINGSSKSKD